jgi:ribonuclease-3
VEITERNVCECTALAIGYRFRDPRMPLEALTHRSFFNEHPSDVGHNERLEFLGDAVLGMIVAETLMQRMPLAAEGVLTASRARLVSEVSLANIAERLGIGGLLRLGRGEEKNGGRTKASILSDALEALVGAVYLEAGVATAKDVVAAWFCDALNAVVQSPHVHDVKTKLQEHFQALHGPTPRYQVASICGPDHDKTYTVDILLGDTRLASGSGRSKKEAEKEAARQALKAMDQEVGE